MRRGLAVWIVLAAVYATALGLPAGPGGEYAETEARVLLAAESIVSDGDLDLRDEYRGDVASAWRERPLEPVAGLTRGRLHEPTGVGFPLLVAPVYDLGGPLAVEGLVAALTALAFAAGAALARRLVPDPWATAGTLLVGLSPPAVAWATTISPQPVAAAALAGAAVLALRAREDLGAPVAFWCAALIAVLPWLGVKFALSAGVVALTLARWLRRRQRSLAAFVALEVALVAAVVLVSVNRALYGGLTPYDAKPGSPTGAEGVVDHLARADRIGEVLLGPDTGVLVWAPVLALVPLGVALLARSIRERLAATLPGQADAEVAGLLLLAVCVAQLGVAVFLAPDVRGQALPAPELVVALPAAAGLAAWGLRRAPRAGAVLGGATLVATGWMLIATRLDALTLGSPSGTFPWGAADVAVAVAVALAAAGLLARQWWRVRGERRLLPVGA